MCRRRESLAAVSWLFHEPLCRTEAAVRPYRSITRRCITLCWERGWHVAVGLGGQPLFVFMVVTVYQKKN